MPTQGKIFLSGIATFRNVISTGYMFIEAILSVLPIVDEMLISDGGSTDGTVISLRRLQEAFPNKIKLFKDKWVKSEYWETFDNSLNLLMSRAKGAWLYEVPGDELIHEKNLLALLKITRNAKSYNSIRQTRQSIFGWRHVSPYTFEGVRMVRNLPKLGSKEGGEFFYVGVYGKPTEGFIAHNVPPETESKIPIYHFPSAFPQNAVAKAKIHATFLACSSVVRKRVYEKVKKREERLLKKEIIDKPMEGLPALVEGLTKMKKYEVRECLFDKVWLNKATKLDYGGKDGAN